MSFEQPESAYLRILQGRVYKWTDDNWINALDNAPTQDKAGVFQLKTDLHRAELQGKNYRGLFPNGYGFNPFGFVIDAFYFMLRPDIMVSTIVSDKVINPVVVTAESARFAARYKIHEVAQAVRTARNNARPQ